MTPLTTQIKKPIIFQFMNYVFSMIHSNPFSRYRGECEHAQTFDIKYYRHTCIFLSVNIYCSMLLKVKIASKVPPTNVFHNIIASNISNPVARAHCILLTFFTHYSSRSGVLFFHRHFFGRFSLEC